MSADMMGMYGLGGGFRGFGQGAGVAPAGGAAGTGADPTNMQSLMLAHMLANQQMQPGAGNTAAGGLSGAGNQMMAYLLANPDAMKKLRDGMGGLGDGIGNLAGGYQWDGMAGAGQLDGLSSEAAGNVAGGAAGL